MDESVSPPPDSEPGDDPPETLPSAEAEPERYRGRPLLVLLENYVLECIGQLEPEVRPEIARVVKEHFGGDGDWARTLREALGLDPKLDAELRRLWKQVQKGNGPGATPLHPVQFAKLAVDQNFGELLDSSA